MNTDSICIHIYIIYLLVGLNESGVDLLQQYIDNTGDIQTAALAMVHSFPSRMQGDERVTSWIKQ